MMYPELMVMVAVAGVIVGLLIVPAVKVSKELLLGVKAFLQASRSKGRVAKRKPQVRRPKGKAAATAQTPEGPKRQLKPVRKRVAKKLAENPPAEKTKRRPGRPSNAELARRAAEAARVNAGVQVQRLEMSPDESVVMPIPEVSPQTLAENYDCTHTE